MIASQPHRAVIALMRAGLGLPVDPAAVSDVAASDPQEIVAIARTHRLLQVVAPGLDTNTVLAQALEPDARIFFREMRAANARRNAALRAVLAEVGQILAEAGSDAVILKGGVELLQPLEGAGDARFIGDLDLLMEADRAEAAQALLIGAGWRPEPTNEIERARHHHLPALLRDEHRIELHRRLGGTLLAGVLPAEALLARARATVMPGIQTPDPADRICHLVLHAQLGDACWSDKRLRLCDIADLARAFAQGETAVLDEARARAHRGGAGDPFDGLLVAAHLLVPEQVEVPPQTEAPSALARKWGKSAVARIGKPGALKRAYLARRVRERLTALLADGERRAHWRRELRRKGGLRDTIAKLRKDLDSRG